MEERILNIIKSIRESHGASIAIYTHGNCYQFYEILKSIFPEAIAYESGGHVYTKIGDKLYDIRGQYNMDDYNFIPVEEHRIESLSGNKCSDEIRLKMKLESLDKINNTEPDKSRIYYEGDRLMIKQNKTK